MPSAYIFSFVCFFHYNFWDWRLLPTNQSINQSIQAVDIYFQHSPTTGAELSMLVDAGWRLHLRFYAAIGAFLAPGGRVIFQENAGGSRPEDFLRMVIDVRLPFCQSIQDLTFWD